MSQYKVEKQEIHNSIRRNAKEIHEIFKVLTPISGESGARLRGFSKIMMEGRIPRNSHELKDELDIKTRGGRKSIIDAFKRNGLIVEKNNELIATERGLKIWNSIIKFIECLYEFPLSSKKNKVITLDNIDDVIQIIRGKDDEVAKNELAKRFDLSEEITPYFDRVTVIVFTDGKEITRYFWNWHLINRSKKPINSHVRRSESGAIMEENKFRLEDHSKNISSYKMISDQPDHKRYELFFSEPVEPGQSIDYWYIYNWPGTYDYTWKEWNMRFLFEAYPCKNFNALLQMPPECIPKEKSFKINTSGTKDYSCFLGEQKKTDPIIVRNERITNLLWRLKNVPTMMKIQLAWEYHLKY